MNLAQKIIAYATLLAVVAFLLVGGHQNVYSGSTYQLDLGGGHRSYYSVRRTDWPRTAIDAAVILAVGGAGVMLFKRKRSKDEHKPTA